MLAEGTDTSEEDTDSSVGVAVCRWVAITEEVGLPLLFLLRNERLPRLRRDLPDTHNLLFLLPRLLSSRMGFLVGATNMLGSKTGINLCSRDIGVP